MCHNILAWIEPNSPPCITLKQSRHNLIDLIIFSITYNVRTISTKSDGDFFSLRFNRFNDVFSTDLMMSFSKVIYLALLKFRADCQISKQQ
ncbi:unnamed protein product [Rhizophagus irregularis]|nr:unnamed protein product [Rhizophagus irregularis]CAB4406129.1 unnamed protein product [Rhizophagus irregularis]